MGGGRPLLKPADQGMDSSRVVREHEVETLACGLVSVMPMAEDTLTAVERQLSAPLPKPQSLPLLGAAAKPRPSAAASVGPRGPAARHTRTSPTDPASAAQLRPVRRGGDGSGPDGGTRTTEQCDPDLPR